MSWWASKNRLSNSDELQGIKLKDAIGKTIICEDGIPRRVVEIVPAFANKFKSIINENDEDSKGGHFVHNYSLAAQILGKPIPDKDAIAAFERMINHRLQYGAPKQRRTKSGIILP